LESLKNVIKTTSNVMAILYACLDGAAASMLWLKIA
jgi:hypothetical protein